jgi:adenylosuccinate synthase
MPGVVIVGLQTGDEGKGKVVDYLAEKADMAVRFGGGPNAGHTVVVGSKTIKLHHIPSGMVRYALGDDDFVCVLGNGMVIDPEGLKRELLTLMKVRNKERTIPGGLPLPKNFRISGQAHMILPTHRDIEAISEEKRGKGKIDTTKKGIGPAYRDKVGRCGIRMMDMLLPYDELKSKVRVHLLENNLGNVEEKTIQWIKSFTNFFQEYIDMDTPILINRYLYDKNVLFEGAQGALLDVDHGTYPYVTSSNTTAGAACTGSGVGPTEIRDVVGVLKAYATRVGAGPFPTVLTNEDGEKLRSKGNEYGTTTGRPRDCGWLDVVPLLHSIRVNGVTHLAITKLDVLNDFDEIKVCVEYEGEEKYVMPADLSKVKPIYKTLPGWKCDISDAKKFGDLPKEARDYIDFIAFCLGRQIAFIGVGPEREQIINITDVWEQI